MLPINITLSYYKQPSIRKEMLKHCRGKEIAIQYGDRFGKRPQILVYEQDILSHAQKKATSFHISEETWMNPMQLSAGMRPAEMNDLRVGWDLILDIDFTEWQATKIIAHELVQTLIKEGIPAEAITAKFSGNKGFHIGVPFEAFPETWVDNNGIEVLTSDIWPDGAKKILEYIGYKADGPHNDYALSQQVVETIGHKDNLFIPVCESCGRRAETKEISGNDLVCPGCGYHERSEEQYMECPKCKTLATPVKHDKARECRCGGKKFKKKIDLGIDTMLVTSRHMYRLVYSLHEKSGLASVPVPIKELLTFDKTSADPKTVTVTTPFLERNVPANAAQALMNNAMQFITETTTVVEYKEIEWSGDAAPEEMFPPPINKMLAGMSDGRKRALFVLTNFLTSVGWTYEMIEERLQKWNEDNAEPLKQNIIQGHIRYHKQKKERVLPPNFDNDMYYKDLGVLEHDELSKRLKNPVQYVRLKKKRGKHTSKKNKKKEKE